MALRYWANMGSRVEVEMESVQKFHGAREEGFDSCDSKNCCWRPLAFAFVAEHSFVFHRDFALRAFKGSRSLLFGSVFRDADGGFVRAVLDQ
ncbi:MAG TPA: hypothetical protein PL182_10240, partial [Pseudobdellovibrionaceae bacterium]|nr:hypothetical protein [Pseudobdellovibrionaceae bacterium]